MDPTLVVTSASIVLAGLSMASAAALRGWHGWLDLKRLEIAGRCRPEATAPTPSALIEMADLRERVRKLEAIATGIEP